MNFFKYRSMNLFRLPASLINKMLAITIGLGVNTLSKKVSRRSYVKYAGAAVVAAAVAGAGYYYTQTRAPSKRILRVNLDAG